MIYELLNIGSINLEMLGNCTIILVEDCHKMIDEARVVILACYNMNEWNPFKKNL